MSKIKIKSDPYKRTVDFYSYNEYSNSWEDIKQNNVNSRLRENNDEKNFFPFRMGEIMETIVSEYYAAPGRMDLIFEGTTDEYEELENICCEDWVCDKVNLSRSDMELANARDILESTKETFDIVEPIIKNIVKDENPDLIKNLNKVSDALNAIIPICIFGNYSAGKSTFINALIGYEILPSGGDPVTAKIFEIKRSEYNDRAKIVFDYCGEEYELVFKGYDLEINKGDKEKSVIKEIIATKEELGEVELFRAVNKTIETLNSYEKRDRSKTLIGNVIHVEVPFSECGKLGNSHNEFVIFDTPGSNSKTNMDHNKVLQESLEGFSNGIPIWVSGYDSIDSVDNAQLCDDLYKIDALDKRFTMIVINKADSVELPKNGFEASKITEIREYESVDKMYSSGIFFVSSIMGLASKNPDGIVSEYILDVFDEKEKKYSDPNTRSYKKLYEYNIMPSQMKKNAINYSKECPNRIYANSGLYCVEMEMEQFASHHAAYNKCQMVYMFLQSIIDVTDTIIEGKTNLREKNKEEWENKLDTKKHELIEIIRTETSDYSRIVERESKNHAKSFADSSIPKYKQTTGDIVQIDNSIFDQSVTDSIDYTDKNRKEAFNNIFRNTIDNFQEMTKGTGIKESFQKMSADIKSDATVYKEKKEISDRARKEYNREKADKLLEKIISLYKTNINSVRNEIVYETKIFWRDKEIQYRKKLIDIIKGSEAISIEHRYDLESKINNYKDFQYDDDADKVFIKNRFLRNDLMSILKKDELIDIDKITREYNYKMRGGIVEMSRLINDSYLESFKLWQEDLRTIIEENIVIYNPELREITDLIKDETRIILELKQNQQMIKQSLETIEDMMKWKPNK